MVRCQLSNAAPRARRSVAPFGLVAAALIAVFAHPAVNHARSGEPKENASKLDRVLRKSAADADTSERRVIVRARRGRSFAVADRLKKHGDRILTDHRRLDSFTASVHGTDLRALEADPDVQTVSVDAVIRTDGMVQESAPTAAPVENLLVAALGLSDSGTTGTRSALL